MGRAPGGGSEHLPQLRLDDLLDELQARLDTARSTRDRVHGLLEAVLAMGRYLELTQVLRHIVESAVALVDAEYGALGVVGEDRRLSQFIPVGVTDEQIERIGPLPSGHGLLGELAPSAAGGVTPAQVSASSTSETGNRGVGAPSRP